MRRRTSCRGTGGRGTSAGAGEKREREREREEKKKKEEQEEVEGERKREEVFCLFVCFRAAFFPPRPKYRRPVAKRMRRKPQSVPRIQPRGGERDWRGRGDGGRGERKEGLAGGREEEEKRQEFFFSWTRRLFLHFLALCLTVFWGAFR